MCLVIKAYTSASYHQSAFTRCYKYFRTQCQVHQIIINKSSKHREYVLINAETKITLRRGLVQTPI